MLYWLTTGLAENPKKNYGIFGYKTKKNSTPVYVVDSESALSKREENAPTKKEKKMTMVGTIVLSSLALLGVVGLGVMGGIKGGDVTSDDSSSSQPAKDLTDIDIDNMVMERLNAAGVRGAEVTLMNPDDPS